MSSWKPIPCTNCLTISTCLTLLEKIKEKHIKWGNINGNGKLTSNKKYKIFMTHVIMDLGNKCKLFDEYMPYGEFYDLIVAERTVDKEWIFRFKMVESVFKDEHPVIDIGVEDE